MTRTLPASDLPALPARYFRFRTPPGVTLRYLEPGEINREPVLVCRVEHGMAGGCNLPQLHRPVSLRDWACTACGKERRW